MTKSEALKKHGVKKKRQNSVKDLSKKYNIFWVDYDIKTEEFHKHLDDIMSYNYEVQEFEDIDQAIDVILAWQQNKVSFLFVIL